MGSMNRLTPFGHEMKKHFLFDPKFTNLNHGSYGTYPKDVRRAYRVYQDIAEAAPDRFIRYESVPLLDQARTEIAEYLHVPVDECVFVQNATTGINVVLRNLTYKPTDVILYFDTIYGACEKTLLSLLEGLPENARPVLRKIGHGQTPGFSLPCTHSDILNSFSQTISRTIYDNLTPKLAIIDTISSLPGVRFPFERLVAQCAEYNILSLIDGAHGVGHIPLNLGELNADFFVSNCHKWLYTPRGCAVFHVPKRNQGLIRTSVPTSHGFVPLPSSSSTHLVKNPLPQSTTTTPFTTLFSQTASTDSSAYYTIPQALKFRREVCGGEAAIYRYTREIAQRGADLMARVLETSVLDDEDVAERGTFLRIGSGSWSSGQTKEGGGWGGGGRVRSGTLNLGEEGGLRGCALANVLLPIAIVGGEEADANSPAEQEESVWDVKLPRSSSMPRLTLFAAPGSINGAEVEKGDVDPVLRWLEERLVQEFNTFVAVFEYRGRMWVRVSGQVYLELRDFEWLGAVLKGLCARVGRGEWKRSMGGGLNGSGMGIGAGNAAVSRASSNGDLNGNGNGVEGLAAGVGAMAVIETPVDGEAPQWQAEYWSHA